MEALELQAIETLRFFVHRENGVVRFHGCIGDTPDLAALDSILTSGSLCDLGHLHYASWIGLRRLDDYLAAHGLKVRWTRVSYSLFSMFRLLPYCQKQTFVQVELPCVGQDSLHEWVDLEKLNRSSDWSRAASGRVISIPLGELFPDEKPRREKAELDLGIPEEMRRMASFWLRYASFSQTTLEMSLDLVRAAEFNLMQLLGDINCRLEAGEEAIRVLHPEVVPTLVVQVKALTRDTRAEFGRLAQRLKSQFEGCEGRLSLMVEQGLSGSPQGFADALKAYGHATRALEVVAQASEECGIAIGGRILSISGQNLLRETFQDLEDPGPESMARIRQAFAIMDFMSEDDWLASRELIKAEIATLDALMSRCVVTLQGFDMMRQILEHRIREFKTLLEIPGVQGPEAIYATERRNEIVELIASQLVTDQEKAAFEFHLPDSYTVHGNKQRQEPGDVLLF